MGRRWIREACWGWAVLAGLGVPLPVPAQTPTPDTLDAPQPPAAVPARPEAPTPAKPPKAPLPSDADLQKAGKEIRELYAKELQLKEAASRLAFAGTLLETALQMKPGSEDAARHELLREACRIASLPGGLGTAFRAADALGESFEGVGIVELKLAAVTAAQKGARSAEDHESVAGPCPGLIEDALRENRHKAALAAAKVLKVSAQSARSPDGTQAATDYERKIPLLEREFEAAARAMEMLRTAPDDPAARLAYGRYLCGRGEWDAGLAHLAKGADAELQAAAELDLRGPDGADAQCKAAERWEAVARKASGPLDRERGTERALFWYRSALDAAADPLSKARIERKVDELSTAAAGRAVRVTFHWSCADDADIYVNGKPIKAFEPDFRTRADEAPQALSCEGVLRRGDIITVGARRGGSYGLLLVAVDARGKVIWKTDVRSWQVYFPPEGGKAPWYLPAVARASRTAPAQKARGWPPQARINERFGGVAESIWHTPESATCFLVSIVR